MAVALDDLRCNRIGPQTKPGANGGFVLGLEVAKRAYGAGELAHPHVFRARIKASQVAHNLGIPVEQFEAEGRWLSVDSVRAPDGWSVLELQCTLAKDTGQREHALANDRRGCLNLQRLRRVDHIVGRKAIVQPA